MTNEQKKSYYKAISDAYLFSDINIITKWIRQNLTPDEVFPQRELLTYLEDNKDYLENKLSVHI